MPFLCLKETEREPERKEKKVQKACLLNCYLMLAEIISAWLGLLLPGQCRSPCTAQPRVELLGLRKRGQGRDKGWLLVGVGFQLAQAKNHLLGIARLPPNSLGELSKGWGELQGMG